MVFDDFKSAIPSLWAERGMEKIKEIDEKLV